MFGHRKPAPIDPATLAREPQSRPLPVARDLRTAAVKADDQARLNEALGLRGRHVR